MKKWPVKLILAAAAIVLVLFAWLLVANVHSTNTVDRYKAQLRAAGEKLRVDDLIPPPPKPESNGVEFFNQATAYFGSGANVFNTNPPPAMRIIAPGKAMIGWEQPEVVSALDKPTTNTWEEIENALRSEEPAFILLRKATDRPELAFDLNYNAFPYIQLTHLMKLKEASLILSAATVSDLHRQDIASAVTNLHTSLRLVNAWQSEPVMISQLVRIAMASIASAAQWELLQASNVTDAQLAMLQSDWEKMEFVRPVESSFLTERDWSCENIVHLRGSNSPSAAVAATMSILSPPSTGGGSGDLFDGIKMLGEAARRKTFDALWRVSWSYDDELRTLQAGQAMVDVMRQIQTNGFFYDALTNLDQKLDALGVNRPSDNWLRNNLDKENWDILVESPGAFTTAIKRTMAFEATRKIVITAIALKRYELRHGSFPTDLQKLVPEFLSEVQSDPVDGKPLRYHPNPDGTFALYSIGEDGKDDGGSVAQRGQSTTFYWLRAADWVWPQPATAQEVQNYFDRPPK